MASRNLGTLTIDVVAKTGGFINGMEKAARSAASNSAKIKKTLGDAAKIVGAGFAASAGVVAAWTAATVNAAVEIERFSALANSAPDVFQRWAVGANTVGIEQGKLADILKDTQDKVGDFIQTGGGPLADFFENIAPKVGVTADEFRRLSGPDALQLYVNSLEKASLSQSDMVFYLEAIASDSALLLPLLRDNGRAMGEWGDKASELGAILSDETIIAAKQAKDDFQELGLIFDGIKNRVVSEVIPAFLNLSDELIGTGDKTSKLDAISRTTAEGIKVLTAAGISLGGAFKIAGTFIGGSIAALVEFSKGNFTQALEIRAATFADAVKGAEETADAVAAIWENRVTPILIEPPPAPNTTKLTEGHKEAAKKVTSEYEKMQNKVKDILAGIEDDLATFGMTGSEKTIFDLVALGASEAQIETAKLGLATRDWLDATIEGMDQIEQYEQDRNDRFRDVIGSLQEEIELMGMTIEQQEIYNNLKWAGVDAESVRGKEIVENTKRLQDQRKQIEDQVNAMDAVRDAGRGFIVDLASGSKSFKESFIDALDSIRDRLLALAAEKIIEKILGQSGTASSGNSGWIQAIGSALSSAFGGGRATGGPVTGGRLYEVGENGNPELLTNANGRQYLIPGNNGSVTPLGTAGTGGGTNVSIVINMNDGATSGRNEVGADQDARELSQLIEGVCTRWALKQSKNGGFFSPTGARR